MNQQPKINQIIALIIICAVVVAIFVYSGAKNSSDAVTLAIAPEKGSVAVGTEFTVDILLDTAKQATRGVDINSLKFDPSIIQVVDTDLTEQGIQIASGSLMPTTVFNSADNTAGTVKFSQVIMPGTDGTSVYSGSGVLARVTFRAVAVGTSQIMFDFTPGSSTDSNVAGESVDLLSEVTGATYTVF